MRYISLLLITIFLASCGNQKIRFVRTNTTKQKVVEIKDISALKVKKETALNPEISTETTENEPVIISSTEDKSAELSEEKALNIPELTSNSFPKSVQDSTTVTQDDARKIENEALRAERLGNWSFGLSMLFILLIVVALVAAFTSFFSYYSLVGAIIGAVLSIVALGSLIESIIVGAKSLNAAYNTPIGRRRALTGVTISSIILGLFLILFLLSLF